MTRLTGQILRMLGLLIEALGILALVLWTSTDEAGVPLPGSFSRSQVWIVIGSGFVIWLCGSIVTYWPRSVRKVRSFPHDDLGELKL
jgi:hypothetical protein